MGRRERWMSGTCKGTKTVPNSMRTRFSRRGSRNAPAGPLAPSLRAFPRHGSRINDETSSPVALSLTQGLERRKEMPFAPNARKQGI
jgi:hypothetical protein